MGLELRANRDTPIAAGESLQFVSPSFWFWFKAGMGFSLGSAAIASIAVVVMWTVGLALLTTFGALLRAGGVHP